MSEPNDELIVYEVITHPGAEADIDAMVDWLLDEGAGENALKWARRLRRFITALDTFPSGRQTISTRPPRPAYSVPFERRRLVIFEVFEAERVVRVLYVWHGYRKGRPDLGRQDDLLDPP